MAYLLFFHSSEKYSIKCSIKSLNNPIKLKRFNNVGTLIKTQCNYNHNRNGILCGLINLLNKVQV